MAFSKSGGFPNRSGGGNNNRYGFKKESQDEHRINHHIRVPQVRLISETGEQLGIVPTHQAIQIAEDRGLDLVEVAETANPPVCKLMDYGKFKYKEQKKAAEAKKHRTEVVIKELRIRYATDKGDLETKLKHAREFIEEGNKVKFSMRFRGREAMYNNLGVEKFKEIAKRLEDIAAIDEQQFAQGRQIHIIFAPIKVK